MNQKQSAIPTSDLKEAESRGPKTVFQIKLKYACDIASNIIAVTAFIVAFGFLSFSAFYYLLMSMSYKAPLLKAVPLIFLLPLAGGLIGLKVSQVVARYQLFEIIGMISVTVSVCGNIEMLFENVRSPQKEFFTVIDLLMGFFGLG